MAVLPTGIGPVTGGGTPANAISRSLRFNSIDSAHLTRTLSSSGNRKKWTMSVWQKGFVSSRNGGNQNAFLSVGTGNNIGDYRSNIVFNSENFYFAYVQIQTAGIISATATPVYRDPSAWYHFMCVFDSDNATQNDRVRLYVNGSRVSASVTCPSGQQTDINNSSYQHKIGILQDYTGNPTYYADMFLAEQHFVDGQNLLPSDFGETDSETGIWKPKPYTGTYGTNGFYLNFSDNSNTTAATLGKDYSGNGNNWTPNNFSVTAGVNNDSMVDSPTAYGTDTGVGGEVRGNYCTLNPLTPPVNGSLSNGNLLFTGATDWGGSKSTFAIPTTGKWYAEFTLGSTSSNSAQGNMGIFPAGNSNGNAWAGSYGLEVNNGFFLLTNGSYSTNRTGTTAGGTVLQIAVDADAGKVWFGVANAWYDTYNTTNGNPGAGTNPSGSSINFSTITYFMGVKTDFNNWTANFGQRPFAYTAPSGFKALCTQNLPTPTIGATSTTQAGKYFNPILWTATDAASRALTGVGFQPDFLWAKSRNTAGVSHRLYDAVRGATTGSLVTDSTAAEDTTAGQLTSFNTDGFTTGTNKDYLNYGSRTYVGWCWKANGAGSSNTAGTITSTVSANTTSGFSIVTYTGNGTSGATVGHGLGVAPSMVIVKGRVALTDTADWIVYHSNLTSAAYHLKFNLTEAQSINSTYWNSTAPSSTVFTLGNNNKTNESAKTYVAYCFAPVAGYSAFGSYTGNGSTDGPFVFTNFRPAFVLIKRTDAVENWFTLDYKRDTYNGVVNYLRPNLSDAEAAAGTPIFDFLSNGFKLRNSASAYNASGGTYIYMALAENPFKYSLAR